MLSMTGLISGLVLLIVLTMRGMNLLIAAPIAALVVAIFSGMPLFHQLAPEGQTDYITSYMNGFSGFITSWFMMFLMGAVFGKLMEDSGAADSTAEWIVNKIGAEKAPLAIIIACAVLTYGGVSLFIVAFSVYPMAVSLFKKANLPRRFIPAALAFGSITFTMTSAGSPEIQNWIPIEFLGTSPFAGWKVSIIVAIFMMIFGYWWLMRMIRRAVDKGEHFNVRKTDPVAEKVKRKLPNHFISFIPLLVVLAVTFILHDLLAQSALIVALLSGCISTYILYKPYFRNFPKAVSSGTMGALLAIANTSAVVGFGGVVKATPAFMASVDFITGIPGDPLIGSAVAISVIAGITGSASGGQAIALPIIAPHYLDMGVDPDALHRITSISSGALDSLPHNGYVVTTIRAIANETHQAAYLPFGAVTVIVPLIGVILAIVLFSLGF